MAITGVSSISGQQIIAAGALSAASAGTALYDENGTSLTSYLTAVPEGYATTADLTGKQDVLTFGYDGNNAISSINESAIAGGGGGASLTYTYAQDNIDTINGSGLNTRSIGPQNVFAKYNNSNLLVINPQTSIFGTTNTGFLSPLNYATGACVATSGASFRGFYKGNEWYVCQTGIGYARVNINNTFGDFLTLVNKGNDISARLGIDKNGKPLVSLDGSGYHFSANNSGLYFVDGTTKTIGISGIDANSAHNIYLYDYDNSAYERIYPSSIPLWNGVSAKQDTLTFGYDAQNKISSINESAIAGGGGTPDFDIYGISASANIELVEADSALWISGRDWTPELSNKQDNLTFGYDAEDRIISINSSAIAGGGGGGSTYTSPSGTILIGGSTLEATTSAVQAKEDTFSCPDNEDSLVSTALPNGPYTTYKLTNDNVYNVTLYVKYYNDDWSHTLTLAPGETSAISAEYEGNNLYAIRPYELGISLIGETNRVVELATKDELSGGHWESATLYSNPTNTTRATAWTLSNNASAYDYLESIWVDVNGWRIKQRHDIPSAMASSGTRGANFNSVYESPNIWFKSMRWSAIQTGFYMQVDEFAVTTSKTIYAANPNQIGNRPLMYSIVGWKFVN